MEDSPLFLRKFVQFEFWNGNVTLKIFQHQEQFHYFAKTTDEKICDVKVKRIDFKSLLYPVPEIHSLSKCKNTDRLGTINSDNFWYENAFHLLHNQQFKLDNQNQKEKKYVTGSKRQVVLNIQMYQDEQTFLSTKIYPNIPSDQQARKYTLSDFQGPSFCKRIVKFLRNILFRVWTAGVLPSSLAQGQPGPRQPGWDSLDPVTTLSILFIIK